MARAKRHPLLPVAPCELLLPTAGFTNRAESEYDPFGAGHSSTSVSAALGMAVGRDFKVIFLLKNVRRAPSPLLHSRLSPGLPHTVATLPGFQICTGFSGREGGCRSQLQILRPPPCLTSAQLLAVCNSCGGSPNERTSGQMSPIAVVVARMREQVAR